jgi:hypothetical protein
MFKRYGMLCAVLSAAILAACSGGSGSPSTNVLFGNNVAVPGWGAGILASFDLGTVDGARGRYYLTDRTNNAVDVIDTRSNTLIAQVKGTGALAFKGLVLASTGAADSAHSGPNGINIIPGTNKIYVGDAGAVKIMDASTNTITASVKVSNTVPAPRADEACVDTDDNLYMIASPEEVVPFYTVFSTLTDQVLARITFIDPAGNPSAGIEQCAYDKISKNFYTNNDGTTANPSGELTLIPAAAVKALIAGGPQNSGVACTGPFTGALAGMTDTTGITNICANISSLAGVQIASQGLCEPKGLDLGPGNDLIVVCSQTTGAYATGTRLTSLIFNRANLATPPVVVPFGGGDQVAYDAATNRYYITGTNWTPSGGKGATGATLTPSMGIVDAATRQVVTTVRTGFGSHSVAVDGVTRQAYVPFAALPPPPPVTAASRICADGCPGFPNGGVSVFATGQY